MMNLQPVVRLGFAEHVRVGMRAEEVCFNDTRPVEIYELIMSSCVQLCASMQFCVRLLRSAGLE